MTYSIFSSRVKFLASVSISIALSLALFSGVASAKYVMLNASDAAGTAANPDGALDADGRYALMDFSDGISRFVSVSEFRLENKVPVYIQISISYSTQLGDNPPPVPPVGTVVDDVVTFGYQIAGVTGATSTTFVPADDRDLHFVTLNITPDRAWTEEDIMNLSLFAVTSSVGAPDTGRVKIEKMWAEENVFQNPDSNTAPEADNLMISPATPDTNVDLVGTYDFRDEDNEIDAGSQIRWYEDGGLVSVLNDMTIVPAGYTTSGSTWYFTVLPFDGIDYGALATSPSVTVAGPANNAPALFIVPPQTVTAGSLLTFTVTGSDPDGDILSYSAVSVPAGAVLDSNTGVFAWTPDNTQVGTTTVTFFGTDGVLTSTGMDVQITVLPQQNLAPVLNPVGNQIGTVGNSVQIQLSAYDPNGDALLYGMSGQPAGATLSALGLFSWTPGADGNYPVTFTVSDGTLMDAEKITISVGAVDFPPTLDPIPAQLFGTEGVPMVYQLNATDPDGDLITYSMFGAMPVGAGLDPLIGKFSWTPAADQSGSYFVDFTASSGSPALGHTLTTELVIADANQPPVLDPIGNQLLQPQQQFILTLNANDPDGDALTFYAFILPSGATFDELTGVFDWTPARSQRNENYTVRFSVTDGVYSDSETVVLSVGDTDLPPQLDPILPLYVGNEGLPFVLDLNATDPDSGQAITYSGANFPAGATIDSLTGVFSWTPTFIQAGLYTGIAFTASSGNPALMHALFADILVLDTNQPPVLNTIGPQTASELSLIAFTATGSDPDGDAVTFQAPGLPAGALFNGFTGSFSWVPDLTQEGVYVVTFSATDGLLSDSEIVTFVISGTNQAPVLDPIGPKVTTENVNLSFIVTGSDSDFDSLAFSASPLPAGATFDSVTGMFSWTPTSAQVGSFVVTFTVSDGTLIDFEDVTINVLPLINNPPVLDPIGNQTGIEGAALSFTLTGSDPDGNAIFFSASGLPVGATLDVLTGAFDWTPDLTQAGTYTVTFTITDGALTDSEIIDIVILDANEAPVLDPIGAQAGAENSAINFFATASDPNGDALTFDASPLPLAATFDTVTGLFSWTPDFSQAGIYTVTFSVTDGLLSDTEDVTFTISGTNQAPVLDPIGNQVVAEGDTLTFIVTASDPDGDPLILDAAPVPSGATFDPFTGIFTWVTGAGDSGNYNVLFSAEDPDAVIDFEIITISVGNVDLPPQLDPIPPFIAGSENSLLTYIFTASDPDGDVIDFSAFGLPAGAALDPVTGVLSWTPDFMQAGTYTITITARSGFPPLTHSLSTDLVIANTNQAPVLSPVGPQVGSEGTAISVLLNAADPDFDALLFDATPLLAGATFDSLTGFFSWIPDFTQAGVYFVTFSATDGTLTDTEDVTFTIGNTNQAPVLDPIGNRNVGEGSTLALTVTGSDPDPGDTITFSASSAVTFTFDSVTGAFSYSPGPGDAGNYGFTFTVTDSFGATDTEIITVSVGDVDFPPQLDPLPPQFLGNENSLMIFTLNAVDPDGDLISYSATGLPTGASLNPVTGAFDWTPDFTQAGTYTVIFTASSGLPALTHSLSTDLVIANTNQAPVLNPIGPQFGAEGALMSFVVSGSDADGDAILFSVGGLPGAATIDSLTGVFDWTPNFIEAGVYIATFAVRDGAAIVTEDVTFTIANTNQAPVLNFIGNQAVDEGALLAFTVSGSDPDFDALIFSSSALPAGAAFDAVTGAFSWTPAAGDSGNYPVTFTVTDSSGDSDSESVTISVGNVDLPPQLTALPAQIFGAENSLMLFTLTATDPDGDTIAFSAVGLPAGATLDPLTGELNWTPDFTQAGTYTVIFTASSGLPALTHSLSTDLVIANTNQPPVLNPIGPQFGTVGVAITFTLTAFDADGDSLLFSSAPLTALDPVTGVFTWTPTAADVGLTTITFIVSDGTAFDVEAVDFNISALPNIPPVLDPIGPQVGSENSLLNFVVTASDPDADPVTLSAAGLPVGAVFDTATGLFTWTPNFIQAGIYAVTFTADDGTFTDTEVVAFTIANTNQAPVLNFIGNQAVDEGVLLSFIVTAADADAGDTLTFSASALPAGAAFDAVTGAFSWTPAAGDSGNYPVTFTVTDSSGDSDSESITISVGNVDLPPQLGAIPAQILGAENSLLTYTLTATDPDGDTIAFSAVGLPVGATLDPLTGELNWTPDFTEAGTYTITVTASSGSPALTHSLSTDLVIANTNQAPVLAAVGNQTVSEGSNLSFVLSVSDADALDILIFTAVGLPAGAFLDPATGAFSWTPGAGTLGNYAVQFEVTDGTDIDFEAITISVGAVLDLPPQLDPIPAQITGNENLLMAFTLTATDSDGDAITFSASGLPAGATLNAVSGAFSWMPGTGEAGTYTVIFTATSGVPALSHSLSTDLVISAAPPGSPPVIAPIDDFPMTVGGSVSFTVTATDADGDPVALSVSGMPGGGVAAFDPLTGAFVFVPNAAGVYTVTFTATSGVPAQIDTEVVVFTVNPSIPSGGGGGAGGGGGGGGGGSSGGVGGITSGDTTGDITTDTTSGDSTPGTDTGTSLDSTASGTDTGVTDSSTSGTTVVALGASGGANGLAASVLGSDELDGSGIFNLRNFLIGLAVVIFAPIVYLFFRMRRV